MRYFGECAVAVVDITEVLFFVVVCNIDVRPAVVVQIADCSAQSEIQSAPMDSGLLTHFDKLTIVVAIQLVAEDRKSTRLNSSHVKTSYAVFCLKQKTLH